MNSLLFSFKLALYELKLCFKDVKHFENTKTLHKDGDD